MSRMTEAKFMAVVAYDLDDCDNQLWASVPADTIDEAVNQITDFLNMMEGEKNLNGRLFVSRADVFRVIFEIDRDGQLWPLDTYQVGEVDIEVIHKFTYYARLREKSDGDS